MSSPLLLCPVTRFGRICVDPWRLTSPLYRSPSRQILFLSCECHEFWWNVTCNINKGSAAGARFTFSIYQLCTHQKLRKFDWLNITKLTRSAILRREWDNWQFPRGAPRLVCAPWQWGALLWGRCLKEVLCLCRRGPSYIWLISWSDARCMKGEKLCQWLFNGHEVRVVRGNPALKIAEIKINPCLMQDLL